MLSKKYPAAFAGLAAAVLCLSVLSSCENPSTAETVPAQEAPSEPSVAYDANSADSGSVPVDPHSYAAGDRVSVLPNSGKLVRAGFRFCGWNSKRDGSGTVYMPGSIIDFAAPATLYAQWRVPGETTGQAFADVHFDSSVYSMQALSDGSLLCAGSFDSCALDARSRIAKIAPSGSLDPSFSLPGALNGTIYCAAVQADGRIVIGGNFTLIGSLERRHLARLNEDGSVDLSFAASTNNYVKDILVLPDGSIMIAGGFSLANGAQRGRIAKLAPDGTLDASFAPAGFNNGVESLAAGEDGSILCFGLFTAAGQTPANRIAKLKADGSLDADFASGSGADAGIYRGICGADGSILIGGDFTSYDGTSRDRIARLNADGSLDSSFDPGSGLDGSVVSLCVLFDGTVLAGGNFSLANGEARGCLALFASDVSLDPLFDSSFGSWVLSLHRFADGSVAVGGNFALYDGRPAGSFVRIWP